MKISRVKKPTAWNQAIKGARLKPNRMERFIGSELMYENAHQALSIKRRREIMTVKFILAVALVAPFMTVSSIAQDAPRLDQHAYLGGPKSGIPHATRQVTSVGDAFAMAPKAVTSHRYIGGPQTVVPHSN
jgi:hypothetical protein